MNFQKLNLFRLFNHSQSVHTLSKKGSSAFMTWHSRNIFRSFLVQNHKKYFKITDRTRERISKIPTEGLNGIKLSQLRDRAGENGIVYFTDKLHFAYCITNTSVNILVSEVEFKYTVDDVNFYLSKLFSGYVYMDFASEEIQSWINHPLDILNDNGTLLKREMAYIKAAQKIASGGSEVVRKAREEFNIIYQRVRLCFQSFLFLYLAKIIDTTTISSEKELTFKERLAGAKRTDIDVIVVNTLYDENEKTINPFAVTGHFRNQPIGPGRKETKLIYIDQFMKTGYTRKATKIKVGMNADESIQVPY